MKRRSFISTTLGASAFTIPGYAALHGTNPPKRYNIPDRNNSFKQIVGITLQEHRDELNSRLFDEFLPFWDQGGYDKEYGGFICNLNEEGIPVDDQKFIWYQGRAIWVYAFLYNNFSQNPAYLEIAKKSRDFMVRKMYLGKGRWAELVSRNGNLIKGVEPDSEIYGELFAANGLAEYFKISGNKEDIRLARESVLAAVKAYDSPYYLKGTAYEGYRIQGHSFILIRLLTQLLRYHQDEMLEELLDLHVKMLMEKFYHPLYRISNERLNHDYSRIKSEEGYTYLGHSLEARWMLMDLALQKNDQVLYEWAKSDYKRYLEMGWDHIFGGFADENYYVFGNENHPAGPDYNIKTMWAHLDTMIGLMIIFENSGEPWSIEWYKRIWDYVKETFCRGVPAWEQAVNRLGDPRRREMEGINPMRRGNFHQPRFLMMNMLSLDRMIKGDSSRHG
ncbi:MAG: AGE family epimerase/isomerase [Bacteroidota bacterium]